MAKLKELSPERQQFLVENMRSMYQMTLNAGATVGFELVKHLAIINGAGIAGAAAFSAKSEGVASLPWFCVGMFMAIVTMMIVNVNGLLAIKHIGLAQQRILFADADIADFQLKKSILWTIRVTWLCGGISFLLFLVGVQKLTHVLTFCI